MRHWNRYMVAKFVLPFVSKAEGDRCLLTSFLQGDDNEGPDDIDPAGPQYDDPVQQELDEQQPMHGVEVGLRYDDACKNGCLTSF